MTIQSQPVLHQRPNQQSQALRLLNKLWDTSITLWITMLASSLAVLINIGVISRSAPQTLYILGLFLPLNYLMIAIHEGLKIPALRYSSHDQARSLLGTGLLLLFIIMSVLMAFLAGAVWLFQPVIASLFHIVPERQNEVAGFILPMLLIGIPIGCATLILSTLFGLGMNRLASLLGATGTMLNLVVTWLAATHWHLGLPSLIWGALIGSSYLILTGWVLLYGRGIRLSVAGVRQDASQVLSDIISMSTPVMGSFLLLFGFLFAFNYLVSFYGANEIAGFGIAFRIQSFIILPAIALGTAIAIHANNAVAAQNFLRIRQVFLVGLGLSTLLYLVISVAAFLLQARLVMFFTLDDAVITAALRYLNCVVPSYFSLGSALVMMTALEQTGQGLRVLLINIVFYSLEIGIAAWLGLNQQDATRLYLVIAIMNWLLLFYVAYELNKKLAERGSLLGRERQS